MNVETTKTAQDSAQPPQELVITPQTMFDFKGVAAWPAAQLDEVTAAYIGHVISALLAAMPTAHCNYYAEKIQPFYQQGNTCNVSALPKITLSRDLDEVTIKIIYRTKGAKIPKMEFAEWFEEVTKE